MSIFEIFKKKKINNPDLSLGKLKAQPLLCLQLSSNGDGSGGGSQGLDHRYSPESFTPPTFY